MELTLSGFKEMVDEFTEKNYDKSKLLGIKLGEIALLLSQWNKEAFGNTSKDLVRIKRRRRRRKNRRHPNKP